MTTLELRVPPLLLVVIFAFVMGVAAILMPTVLFPFAGQLILSCGLFFAGVVVAVAGVIGFRKARTTVNPITPQDTSTVVSSGVYSFTRNPMYLGFLLILVAWSVFLASAIAYALLPVFVVYMNRFQIIPEEKALSGKFGASYRNYKAKVRRWL